MTFSLCLQIPNHIRFKRPLDIYANFVPQMIFLQSIFGYLVVCIIYKWTVDWSKSTTSPPSLLNMLILMFLSPGEVDPNNQLYSGQSFVQIVLVLLAVICIPWMLCTKPYFQWKEMRKIHDQGYVGLGQDGAHRDSTDEVLAGEEEGNGRAMAEDADEEHVRPFFPAVYSQFMHCYCTGARRLFGSYSLSSHPYH
jgi:V-type H+-transporting ATPase subunit a